MPQDAFTLYHTAKELNGFLENAKVNRVVQPDKDDVYLAVYTKFGAKTLVLSTNAEYCRVSFIEKEKPKPQVAPSFCMLLRKHLLGAEISSVSLVGFERIVKISFWTRNDFKDPVEKIMYCEIMGKYSNLILTEDGKILGCLKNAPLDVATTRVTLSGAKYELPKSQDKAEPNNKDDIKSRYNTSCSGDVAKFLFENVKGLSFVTAQEIALLAGENIDGERLAEIVENFCFSPEIKPNVKGVGKARDAYVTEYKSVVGDATYFPSIAMATDAVFSVKETNKNFAMHVKSLSDKVNAQIKKLEKRLQGESEKLLVSADYDKLRIKGELITANLYRIKDGSDKAIVENWYDDNKVIEIPLDKTISANKNAQRYFKKYAKEKRAIEIITPQKEETERELDYIYSVRYELSACTVDEELKDIEEELITEGLLPTPKKKNKQVIESACREYVIDGYTVKCGKNNVQNDRLLARAFKDDVWLHTKGFHSPFVIVETKGEEIPDKVICDAAEICAFYSDGGKGGKVRVDYTKKKNVKKPPKAKAGSVIYNDYKTIFVVPNAHNE